MTKKLTEKYNDACVKIFEFLKMLHNEEAEFQKVIELFSAGEYDGSSNTHVTLNKYLNALKIFGIKVKKINNEYKILNSIQQLNFDKEDIKSLDIIKNAGNMILTGKNKKYFDKFINMIEIRIDSASNSLKETLENSSNNNNYQLFHNDLIKQIHKYEQYCQDNKKLEITYINNKNEQINLVCSPVEIIYLKRNVCFKVLGNNGNRIYEIPIDSILNSKQLPALASSTSIPVTIVYKIKNRLALNYRIRDWERVETILNDGSKIIINKNEDLDFLIKRLMRYGKDCEIISPKFFKEEMIRAIDNTLSNYK